MLELGQNLGPKTVVASSSGVAPGAQTPASGQNTERVHVHVCTASRELPPAPFSRDNAQRPCGKEVEGQPRHEPWHRAGFSAGATTDSSVNLDSFQASGS